MVTEIEKLLIQVDTFVSVSRSTREGTVKLEKLDIISSEEYEAIADIFISAGERLILKKKELGIL